MRPVRTSTMATPPASSPRKALSSAFWTSASRVRRRSRPGIGSVRAGSPVMPSAPGDRIGARGLLDDAFAAGALAAARVDEDLLPAARAAEVTLPGALEAGDA